MYIDRERLIAEKISRLEHVKLRGKIVYATSDPESGTHPSAAREFDLAHKLVEELKA